MISQMHPLCLLAVFIASAQASCQVPYNPLWNTPDLPYRLLAQLPSNYGEDTSCESIITNTPTQTFCGGPTPVNTLPEIVAPIQVKTINLPTLPPPAPRVISNTCTCTKTVVQSQIVKRIVKVPIITKYIKKSYVPVEEKITYNGRGLVGPEPSKPCDEPNPLPAPVPCPCTSDAY